MRTAALHSITILIVLALAVATARGAQTPPLQMCLATAADFSPIYPATSFPNNLREVSCAFALDEDESFGTLTSIWTAIDVGDVAPPNYEIARADTPVKSMKRGRFRYSQDGPMPVGKYRLDVLADGKPWHSLEFTVVAAAEPVAIKKPADLFPLEKGKAWSYDFVQESGKGAKITIPGAQSDDQGRFHANVTMTVDKTEPHGTHIEIRRNGELVAEEWWKLGAKGLSATQRKIGDELIKLEPPQTLWALPLQTPTQWTYAPKDGSFTQTYSMWGPLPVRGPSGDQPGYIIAIEQPSSVGKLSVERRLIPGYGLTDEIIISAVNGEMVSRQEMSLSSAVAADPSASSSSAASGSDSFPLSQGAVWTYMATVDGNDRMVSKKVSRSEQVKGLDCFVVEDDGFSGFLTKMHLHKSADAVQLVKASYTMKEPLTWIKQPLKTGDSWAGQLLTTDNQDGGTLRFNVEGEETVDTPAGKYQAMRVRMDGETAGPSLHATMWFAPGVGEVKRSAKLIDAEHDNKVLSQIDMALFEYSDGKSASINSGTGPAAPIKFESDFRKGLERANAEGKPLLVEF